MSCDRHLFKAFTNLWRCDANDVVHSGHDVSNKHELIALCSSLFFWNSVRPMHHHRNMNATFVCVLFVPAIRGVTHLSPTPRIVVVAIGSTNVINVFDCLIRCFENSIEELHFVHYSVRATLLRSPVVGMNNKNCVVELAKLAQTFNKAANLVICVIKESRKSFLQTCSKALFVV